MDVQLLALYLKSLLYQMADHRTSFISLPISHTTPTVYAQYGILSQDPCVYSLNSILIPECCDGPCCSYYFVKLCMIFRIEEMGVVRLSGHKLSGCMWIENGGIQSEKKFKDKQRS